ncbi:MAG: hypothetical protein AAF367_16835 [Pseudomonadota bacterium]
MRFFGVIVLAAFTLSACNTVKGISRDIQSGARAVEQAADEATD